MPTKVSVAADLERELLTAADFLEWLEPGRHADLIDGEVFMHSPVSVRHADLLNFLDGLLRLYIDRHDLGRLYREAVAVRLSGRNVFLPDLAFYAVGREKAARETYLEGPPDLVVEVLSPRTAERDVGPKFAEYEQHGVREYWILDPETLAHRFYRRETLAETGPNAPGGEELVEFAHGEAVISSSVVSGFFVRRQWLDPTKLPKIDDALGGVEAGRR
ncbi:MAG: Uma2 family endonuclease [Spirochaetaceae bacterium]